VRHIHLERESGCKYNAKEHVVLSEQKAIQSNSVSRQCSFVSFCVGRPGGSEVQREVPGNLLVKGTSGGCLE
jgi:hypothetical protein